MYNLLNEYIIDTLMAIPNTFLQKISQNSAMERLTDTSKYGGTHKQRFTPDGKGKGKEGRVDAAPSTFRQNSRS